MLKNPLYFDIMSDILNCQLKFAILFLFLIRSGYNSKRRIYEYKTSGKVEYDEFYPKMSNSIIDQIDSVLAEHYGFTQEELDFIINYDIKYRMGKELDTETEAANE